MPKKERLSEFNRGNILMAAKKLFREKGVAQTTVDDIARMANYSKSTLYVYFESKDEIYNHVILEHIELLKNAVGEALAGAPGFPGGYYAVCDALRKFYAAYPLYFERILDEIKIPASEAETVLTRIYAVGEEINAMIAAYIKAHISQIHLDISPLRATFALWGALGGIITLAHKKEAYIRQAMGVTKEEFMRDGFDLLLRSIGGVTP